MNDLTILEYLPYATLLLGNEWEILHANKAAGRWLAGVDPRTQATNGAGDAFSATVRAQLDFARDTMGRHNLPFFEFGNESVFERTAKAFRVKLVDLGSGGKRGERYFLSAEDITERKQLEENIVKLNTSDILTGLYNRNYYETMVKYYRENQPDRVYGVAICDVDGLKAINDSFGHAVGDAVLIEFSQIMRNCFPPTALLARIGGDEFCALLADCDERELKACCQAIENGLRKAGPVAGKAKLSASVGYALSGTGGIGEAFRAADDYMYRHKLHRALSSRSSGLSLANLLLAQRDFMTQGHAKRLERLVCLLAEKMGLPDRMILEMRLLARFHDIGKIGISERILLKPGPLDATERQEMQRHSEIGYKLAQLSGDLRPIGELILKHHERWDGQGYPLGIAGTDIPVECRILAIVDAFDAMTNDRPYRKAMPIDEARQELARSAGSQFDPEIARLFLSLPPP